MSVLARAAGLAIVAVWVTSPAMLAARQGVEPLKLVQQGRRLNQAGKQEDALVLYERALEADPNSFDAHLAAGIALDLLGRYADARTHLARAIELSSPENREPALDAMAVSLAFESRAAEAAAFYQKAFDAASAERPGAAAEQANALGRLFLECGDADNARRWYRTGYETARRQPNEPGSQLDLWEFRWLHAQARIAARERKGDEARARAEAARALMASAPSLADQGPTIAYLDGYLALYAGDATGASMALRRADQQDPFILMLEARAADKIGDRAAAEHFWRLVLNVNGHSLQNAFARPAARKALHEHK